MQLCLYCMTLICKKVYEQQSEFSYNLEVASFELYNSDTIF